MALFDKLQDVARTVTDAASDTIETGKLKQQINAEKKEIKLELIKLGELYIQRIEAGELEKDQEVEHIMERIEAHKKTIDQYQDSIDAISLPKETL